MTIVRETPAGRFPPLTPANVLSGKSRLFRTTPAAGSARLCEFASSPTGASNVPHRRCGTNLLDLADCLLFLRNYRFR